MDVTAHKLVRTCLNISCICVPKRSFLVLVVFELYRVAGKCDRSPQSMLANQSIFFQRSLALFNLKIIVSSSLTRSNRYAIVSI